jgi:hypothetical protein
MGEGCRFWLFNLASDLREAGPISESEGAALQEDLRLH